MGNTLGGKKIAKVMKINGETMNFKTPIEASEVVKDYPGYVLLESEAVKHYGVRAKPLEPKQQLVPKRLYFLVELPKSSNEPAPRRVRSGITMSAKDRLENLMLSRRSNSDLSSMKPTSMLPENSKEASENGAVRVRMRLPKAEVERLMKESKDEAEAAEKIMDLCLVNRSNNSGENDQCVTKSDGIVGLNNQQMHWKRSNGRAKEGIKAREKRVSFLPIKEETVHIAVAS